MTVHSMVLGIASIVLPQRHRARWREEASAVLMEVAGVRRVWYLLDTVLKVPILARQHRRGQTSDLPGAKLSAVDRAVSALVGAALLAGVLALLAPVLAGAPRIPPVEPLPVLAVSDPLAYPLVMGGLFALVAARSFRSARRHGGGLRYADSGAVLITVFAGAGPLVAGPLAIALGLPAMALVASVLPGAWLAAICAMALRSRTGPWPLAMVGAIAGLALIGVLGSAPLGQVTPGQQPLAVLVGGLSTAVAVPAYIIWSGWSGVRLLLGRLDLLTAWLPHSQV
ncbi:hypothetical protein K1W54_03340 [Micromonospora sp. CPCC 205371]|nr:hypothetical protein [Micromonospora sp. CPCC 205371]